MTTLAALDEFALPASLEAHDPPEARGLPRDGVRMLVSRRASGEISQHGFAELPGLLLPGDLLVINTTRRCPPTSGSRPSWRCTSPGRAGRIVADRTPAGPGKTTVPNDHGYPGQRLACPAGRR